MAKYRLLAPHIIGDVQYPAGTEVGAGTGIPFDGIPSNQMEGLDEDGIDKVNELHQKLYNHDAPWHTPEAERKREEEARLREEEAERERESGIRASSSAVPVLQPATTQTIGGAVPSPGVATPNIVEPKDPIAPLEDTLPKVS